MQHGNASDDNSVHAADMVSSQEVNILHRKHAETGNQINAVPQARSMSVSMKPKRYALMSSFGVEDNDNR